MNDIYNILIVDDEELAIRGIEKGVNWDHLNIGKVFKAHSAETAKRIIDDYTIHILLTDIELIHDTGINLLRWVRANHRDIECIFFTCHAEFEYAQKALRLGAKDFLLKPIPYQKLEETLLNIIKEIQQKEQKKEHYSVVDEMMKDTQKENHSEIINTIKQYIFRNLSGDIKREELAALVNFSPSYIAKLFRDAEGKSISDYILEVRIQQAKHLLKFTNLSITDIAQRTGFGYHSYFTRRFKEIEGITPLQYKSKYELNSDLDDI